jgi:hypothetical protein
MSGWSELAASPSTSVSLASFCNPASAYSAYSAVEKTFKTFGHFHRTSGPNPKTFGHFHDSDPAIEKPAPFPTFDVKILIWKRARIGWKPSPFHAEMKRFTAFRDPNSRNRLSPTALSKDYS